MLRTIIQSVHDVRGLSRLFVELGYQVADGPRYDGARAIARWHAFEVVGATNPEPVHAARALAGVIARHGTRGCAAAVGGNTIAIAAPRIAADGASRALVVDLADPSPFAIRQLQDLAPRPRSTALAHALRVAEVLSSEAAGTQFFAVFRATLERMQASLPSDRGTAADRRLATLLTLTRVLFLYFVQAKGWLDGNTGYLRQVLDDALAQRRPFHRTVLEPLFFGTLNRAPSRRTASRRSLRIPYLNGGLFEHHAVERRLGPVRFPNDCWRDTFDSLFERFRFCVSESSEVDAIAPDMLGRVFERLMEGDERRRSGTFYTPESVVGEIVEAAVHSALVSRSGITPESMERAHAGMPLADSARRRLSRALRQIRLLDPAAGSGAFLLGALHHLTTLRLRALPHEERPGPWTVRRGVLRENLFGVDINPVAVRLTELRLWLAVVADDPSTDISKVEPLPNLDGVVRQGNTLLDPIGTARRLLWHWSPAVHRTAHQVEEERRRVFDAREDAKHPALRRLRTTEFALAKALLFKARDAAARSLDELNTAANDRDLFGKQKGLTTEQRQHVRRVGRNRAAIERAIANLEEGTLPFFSFDVHVPEVVARGGFDVVVGNPPWVRAERLSPDERRLFGDRFRWWRAGGTRGYRHLPDLSLAFLERSLELAAPSGAVAMLMPSKLASAGYAGAARSSLVRETTLRYLHRVPDSEASEFGATTYPLALVATKGTAPPLHRVHLDFAREGSVAQDRLDAAGPWILASDGLLDALDALAKSGTPLEDIGYPALGVKSGADSVFVGVVERAGHQITVVRFAEGSVPIETDMLRPALRGRDVGPFAVRSGRVVLWCHDRSGKPRPSLPRLADAYVRRHEQALQRRSDYRRGPIWGVFRTGPALAPHRVTWPDIARRPRAVALSASIAPDAIPLNTCYVHAAPDQEGALVTAAVLNSTWAEAFVHAHADEARGGYRRVNARVVGAIPLPQHGPQRASLCDLSLLAHNDSRHVTRQDIDAAVARALGLTQSVQERLRRYLADSR